MTIFNDETHETIFHSELTPLIIAFTKIVAEENNDHAMTVMLLTESDCKNYIREYCPNLTICHDDSGYDEITEHDAVHTGKMDLSYFESPYGFHFAIDNSFLDQVGNFKIILPTGEIFDTALNCTQD